jgi:hypothetical protein
MAKIVNIERSDNLGLDMYLERTKRINGLKAKDYSDFCNAIDEPESYTPSEFAIAELTSEIYDKGTSFTWKTIFHEVGYWRKANQIHKWFVDSCSRW